MPETLQEGPAALLIDARQNVTARVYFWNFAGSFGFATEDAEDPKSGERPETNYFLKNNSFIVFEDRSLCEKGFTVTFDVPRQVKAHGKALETKNIRLVR